MSDLISREDAITAVAVAVLDDRDELEALRALPSAEAEPTVIQSKTLFPTKDFMEWAKRIKEVNPNAVVIPCDAEVASAEAVQVVRCKDCRYFKKIAERSDSGLCHRDIVASAWKENGYCSRGERKGGDDE